MRLRAFGGLRVRRLHPRASLRSTLVVRATPPAWCPRRRTAITDLNRAAGPGVDAFARLLLRTGSIASSKVEGMQVDTRRLARAYANQETGRRANAQNEHHHPQGRRAYRQGSRGGSAGYAWWIRGPGVADLSDPALNHLKAKLGSAFNAGALLYAGADRPVRGSSRCCAALRAGSP